MKRTFAAFLFAALLLPLAALGGCSRQTSAAAPVNLIILAGNHGNSEIPDFDAPVVRQLVYQACLSYGNVGIIRVDGNPNCVSLLSFARPQADFTSAKLAQIAASQANGILQKLASIKAAAGESDLLAAFGQAAAALRQLPSRGVNRLLVLDTGLSTGSGALSFTQGDTLDADPQALARACAAEGALPDGLRGVSVTWPMGWVAAPQQSLSAAQRSRLKQIWKALLEKAGANVDIFDSLSTAAIPANSRPAVSTVNLLEDDVVSRFPAEGISLHLSFRGDSANYLDPAQARSSLQPLAAYLTKNPSMCILLAGTTATGGDEQSCIALSRARAQTARATLLSLGVAAERIRTVACGDQDFWHIKDTDSSGALVESLARTNRKVVALNLAGEQAKRLLAQFSRSVS